MKALNRAIARTVSQIHRITTPDDCYLPLVDKLRQHLDDLMALELKQLEQAGMKFATLTGDGTGEALPGLLQPHANDNAQAVTSAPQEPPSLPPHDWREGDALVCVTHALASFVKGGTYRILRISPAGQCIVRNHDGHERDISNFAVRHFKNYTRREAAA